MNSFATEYNFWEPFSPWKTNEGNHTAVTAPAIEQIVCYSEIISNQSLRYKSTCLWKYITITFFMNCSFKLPIGYVEYSYINWYYLKVSYHYCSASVWDKLVLPMLKSPIPVYGFWIISFSFSLKASLKEPQSGTVAVLLLELADLKTVLRRGDFRCWCWSVMKLYTFLGYFPWFRSIKL